MTIKNEDVSVKFLEEIKILQENYIKRYNAQ